MKIIKLFPEKEQKLKEIHLSIRQLDMMISEHLNKESTTGDQYIHSIKKKKNIEGFTKKFSDRIIDIHQNSLSWISNVFKI